MESGARAADNIPVPARAASALCSSISRRLEIHLSATIHEKAKASILPRRAAAIRRRGTALANEPRLGIHEHGHFHPLLLRPINRTDTDPSLASVSRQKARECAITAQTPVQTLYYSYLSGGSRIYNGCVERKKLLRSCCKIRGSDGYIPHNATSKIEI